MKREMTLSFLSLLLILGMVMSACTPAAAPTVEEATQPTGEEAAPTEEQAPPEEEPAPAAEEPTGTLTWMMQGSVLAEFDPINHHHLGMLWSEINVYDRLIELDVDGNFEPGLAVEWEYLDDTTLYLKLRQGVEFHDGSDFTAEDVKASYERYSDPDQVSASWWPSGPVTVEIIDEYTVHVKTEQPSAPLMYSVAFSPIAPAEYHADPELFKENGQMGTGPFKFKEYDAGNETIIYEANMDYWDGPPRIAELRLEVVADPNTMLAALQTGEADIITRPEPEHVEIIDNDPNLHTIQNLAIEQMFLGFKTLNPPVDDPLVRRALAHAIDKETICYDILLGQCRPADSHLSISSFGYAVPENNIPYDPDKAIELLKEAGYDDPADLGEIGLGIMLGFYPKAKEYGEYVIQNLQDIGINAVPHAKEVGALYAEMLEPHPPWHMWMTGFYPSSPEPDLVLYALFKSPGLLSNYESETLDETILAEGREIDPEKRAEIFEEETLPALMEELPEFPLFTSMFILGVNNRVQNLEVPGTGALHFHEVWLAE